MASATHSVPRPGRRRPGASQTGTIANVTTQIAVRLPDEVVAGVDRLVTEGRARSRADLVTRALRRELRRERAEQDLLRLGSDGYAELADFTDAAARSPMDLD
jgi:Arc/MetJ-type ribon-helix-helix transcriptional regulator